MHIAVNLGISAVISTISGVYNSDIAKFYKNLGAKRIILPRDLSVSEIEAIIHVVPDMEYGHPLAFVSRCSEPTQASCSSPA